MSVTRRTTLSGPGLTRSAARQAGAVAANLRRSPASNNNHAGAPTVIKQTQTLTIQFL